MERYEKIWISSDGHLQSFKEVRKNQEILKTTQNPKLDDKYYDFPRKLVSGRIFPLIFENIGNLAVSDDSIQIYINSNDNSDKYFGINKCENIFISFNQIKAISLFRPKMSFLRYFDITWVKLTFDTNGIYKSILLSNSGQGFVMNRIKKKNIDLFNILEKKIK